MKDVLKLALEALEMFCEHGAILRPIETRDAIKEALSSVATVAQPTSGDYALGYAEGFNDACKKPAQQEPFEYWNAVEGWVKIDEVRDHMDSVGCGTIYKTAGEGRVPLAIAQTQQEPVAWYCMEHGEAETIWSKQQPPWEGQWKPLYTFPPPVATQHERPWIGLTIEDKKEYVAQDFGGCRFDAMDWAEKRLKEKNT